MLTGPAYRVMVMTQPESLRLAVAGEVRAAMARRKVTQAQLATALGMAQPTVSQKLAGHSPWTVDELGAAAAFLGTSLADLVADAA